MIPPPLRGPGWGNGNSCCDPNDPHRYTLLPANGRLNPIETFAIDWLRIRGGVWFHGDGQALGDYPGYGAKIHSVAAGTVVSAVDGRPEAPINHLPVAPFVDSPDQFPGNHVTVKIGQGKYAFYAHMQPGSVRVKPGQQVRTGEVLGLLGNSGNSTRAPPSLLDPERPPSAGLEQPSVRHRSLPVPGARQPGSDAAAGHPHRQAPSRAPGLSAERHGG